MVSKENRSRSPESLLKSLLKGNPLIVTPRTESNLSECDEDMMEEYNMMVWVLKRLKQHQPQLSIRHKHTNKKIDLRRLIEKFEDEWVLKNQKN